MRTVPRKLVGAACNYVVFRRAFSQRANGIVPELSVPVLIVGAGPVGLTLSILLAKLGIKCSVVEKKSEFLQHPQAHFINNRTMEIFRKIGSLSTDIERLQPPIDQWRKFIYCTSLTGLLLGEVDHLHPQDLARNHSPTWVAHFSQHRLLSLLQLQAEQLGIHIYKSQEFCLNNLGHINLGYECVSIEQGSENVKARFSRTDTNTKDLLTINCSFLIGADGASSKVRKLLNIQMEGEEALQNLVSIHFFSMDLANHLIRNRPGMLYFVFNTKAIGVFVAHDLRSGEFIVQVPFYPPQQTFEAFTIDACKTIICDLAGTTDIHIDIKAVKQWIMHAQVAESYISRNGRVILAGDAAHRFPPAGGFGMNTGIQDAHNLAWKIGAVLRGVASHNLLRTYESERKPVAKANTALSLENFKAAMSIPSILGLDPSSARFIHEQVNGGIGSLLPHQVQKNIMEGIFALGRMQVGPLVLNSYNPLGSIRLKKLKHMLGEGRSLQLQFPAEDLGFRYHSGALLINEEEMQSYTDEHYVPGRRNEYKPVCAPGARIPHSNIRLLKSDFTKSDEAS
ncbi:hypothetical protein KP509_02G109200 [Ceratopteris richardii]|uniref:FAD-binding domain-containing protein n=1 Tax=Ceratopteris richardii TaxID=49495 RepID=A0A8T2VGI3_CERRI|nr:hypothetical protein KP509_02G109200 [Ceratopteris richardii]